MLPVIVSSAALMALQPGPQISACPSLYKEVIHVQATELCNKFYVSVYDENNKAVRFVSEKLSPGRPTVNRVNAFKADPRVKSATPADYARSGYDKGHMAPADDASTPDEMLETFYMTNMTPQEPTLNRGSWKSLEMNVRKMAATETIYVLTIPVYNSQARLSGIPVPTGYWKIVQGTKNRYFYADNKPNAKVQEVSAVDPKQIINNQKF